MFRLSEKDKLPRIVTVLLGGLPVVLLAAMAIQRRWICDDAFIDLRVVENLLSGLGPVYNPGERVEVYTNPLWVAVLSGWAAIGGPYELGAVLLGGLFSLGGLAFAQASARRLAITAGARVTLPLGALVFACVPAVWDFSTSGLETGLSILWLGWTQWLVTRVMECHDAPCRRVVRVAAVAGLGPLVRPDLGLFAAAFVAVLAGSRLRRPREAAAVLVAAAALPVCYQLFRMGYFAGLVPNTALAKEAGLPYWGQGWMYLLDTAGTYQLWYPLALLAPFAVCQARALRESGWPFAAWAAPAAAAVASALYVARVGGDFMHGRMLIPALFGALLPVSEVGWKMKEGTAAAEVEQVARWRLGAGVGLALWSVVCGVWLRPASGGVFEAPGVTDERGFYVRATGRQNPIEATDYRGSARWDVTIGICAMAGRGKVRVERRDFARECGEDQPQGFRFFPMAPRDPAVTLVAPLFCIGLEGFLSGPSVHIVDRMGLADPIASRLRVTERRRPGHEKRLLLSWVVARFAAPGGPEGRTPRVAAARRALACGPLRELLAAVEEPMTPGRFARNVALAWRLSRLRIPPDPLEAERELCGR